MRIGVLGWVEELCNVIGHETTIFGHFPFSIFRFAQYKVEISLEVPK